MLCRMPGRDVEELIAEECAYRSQPNQDAPRGTTMSTQAPPRPTVHARTARRLEMNPLFAGGATVAWIVVLSIIYYTSRPPPLSASPCDRMSHPPQPHAAARSTAPVIYPCEGERKSPLHTVSAWGCVQHLLLSPGFADRGELRSGWTGTISAHSSSVRSARGLNRCGHIDGGSLWITSNSFKFTLGQKNANRSNGSKRHPQRRPRI
jgi:hypothetical protein